MRSKNKTVGEDTPTEVLLGECAAITVDALVAELRPPTHHAARVAVTARDRRLLRLQ